MFSKLHCCVVLAAVAAGAVHCGKGATPESNTADNRSPSAIANESQRSDSLPTEEPAEPIGAAQNESYGVPSEPNNNNPATTPAESVTEPASRGLAANKSLSDAQIVAITDATHSAEVEQGRLAQSKAKDWRVRDYASMMIKHHTQAKQDQASLHLGSTATPDSERLKSEAQTTVEQLKQKSGAEFDRAYLEVQVQAHRDALATIERTLLPSVEAPELKAQLEKSKASVQQHLVRAEDLVKQLNPDGTKSASVK